MLIALELRESNFKVLLRFRLGLFNLMPAVPGLLLMNGALSWDTKPLTVPSCGKRRPKPGNSYLQMFE